MKEVKVGDYVSVNSSEDNMYFTDQKLTVLEVKGEQVYLTDEYGLKLWKHISDLCPYYSTFF